MATTRRLTADDAAEAGALLASGKLVAFPTETVYGLGADATDGEAIARLYAAKGRPSFNPLISHVTSLAAAEALGRISATARALGEAFWPGPLTLVVPATETCAVSDLARAGLGSVALRVPDHPVARALIEAADRPIAAPSANRSGRVSPTTAAHVLADLDGRIDAVVDGGPTAVGLESTIVALLDDAPRLLRPGGLSRAAIEAVLGRPLEEPLKDEAAPLAPGRLASHYAPTAKVRLDAEDIFEGEAYLGFGPDRLGLRAKAVAYETLSASGDTIEAAARLFSCLRALDATGATAIAVAPIPDHGLGEAIRDRLARAAAPRG
ncbi:L-threonylcarbamoyladenylate synthase [Methylopila sp. M107]|uniref:L-threonylcarbamoyladenylate synthase n=1 Tax=Methylopila sp. M107 TaxID=1101190 RepID=UPI00035D9994|nr:L-threonylcarbamoyladenylate synthase [Methylopila sp. M107]